MAQNQYVKYLQMKHPFFQKLKKKLFLILNSNKWAFQWKVLFNPDPSKQAIEIRFSHKCDNDNHTSLDFNDAKVQLYD